MSWTTIRQAHAYWRLNRGQTDPPCNLEQAETLILSSRPISTEDAAYILDVVCSYNGDGRCDGLDQTALRRIRGFLFDNV
jgi:hypothetical protein